MTEISTQDWLAMTVQKICSIPEQVEVDKKIDTMGELYVVRTAPEDRGRIIGKQGQIADALRIVLRAVGYLKDVRVSMSIDAPSRRFEGPSDDDLGLHGKREKFVPDPYDGRTQPKNDYDR
jgi:uncharacterized protein